MSSYASMLSSLLAHFNLQKAEAALRKINADIEMNDYSPSEQEEDLILQMEKRIEESQ